MRAGRTGRWATIGLAGLALAAVAETLLPAGNRSAHERMAAQTRHGGHVAASAFAVAPGRVVTNAHVTLQCRLAGLPLTVAGEAGWQVSQEDPSSELALLDGPRRGAPPPMRLSAAPQLPHGTPVMLLGYPLGGDGEPGGLRVESGRVRRAALTVHRPDMDTSISFITTAPDGHDVDPRWSDGIAYFGHANADRLRWVVEIAAPSNHGDSGGPVIDADGHLVGVVFAGSPDHAETSAVTLDDLRDFLLSVGITPLFAPPADDSQADWRKAVMVAAPSVVPVGC